LGNSPPEQRFQVILVIRIFRIGIRAAEEIEKSVNLVDRGQGRWYRCNRQDNRPRALQGLRGDARLKGEQEIAQSDSISMVQNIFTPRREPDIIELRAVRAPNVDQHP
jgi:hypothetical protein